ncbi:TPA: hypothetical protein N2D23_000921 [Pseudomonas aeruginosa]|nr:hypothetical protein [Pseudomonas aeruginosa]
MSEVKRFDHVNHAHIDDCEHVESSEGAWVTASDYDALAAEAQSLREEVERGNRITVAMALDISAVGEALGIPGEEQEGGTGEFIDLIRELQKEVEALRARVAVVPERMPRSSDIASIHQHSTGWNACLDELARLNGLTVSEGLLRRLCEPLLSHADYLVARNELRALLSKQE